MKNIAILVLAAGKSSRMKSIKQLEKINNKTLLELTLEKAKSLLSKNIYCVLGANSNEIKSKIKTEGIEFIKNENFENGLSTSIISGINYFKNRKLIFDGIFILLADQPAIEVNYLKNMLHLFEKNKGRIIASKYGEKLGVPVIFPENNFLELLLISGDKGAKEFINLKKNEIICPVTSANFVDLDTKEDLVNYKNSILK